MALMLSTVGAALVALCLAPIAAAGNFGRMPMVGDPLRLRARSLPLEDCTIDVSKNKVSVGSTTRQCRAYMEFIPDLRKGDCLVSGDVFAEVKSVRDGHPLVVSFDNVELHRCSVTGGAYVPCFTDRSQLTCEAVFSKGESKYQKIIDKSEPVWDWPNQELSGYLKYSEAEERDCCKVISDDCLCDLRKRVIKKVGELKKGVGCLLEKRFDHCK